MGCTKNNKTIVNTKYGALEGQIEDSIAIWKGIPYAAAPVGPLRWEPPQDLTPWDGVRKAHNFGPICPQKGYGPESIYTLPPEPMSEDCLYLNIWSANYNNSKQKKPVLVWIHGGSLTREGGSLPLYYGKNLAKKDIVYVSLNYRLNAFGFMAHPELSRASSYDGSGNYGIMDQIKALEWLRDNISVFGGDPDNITIAGESAGGWSVSLLMATQKAKGLFHKAILQSGVYLWPGPHLKQAHNGYTAGELQGDTFMKNLGASSLQELKAVPAQEIVDLFFSKANTLSAEPMIDDFLFHHDIPNIYKQQEQHNIAVILGANANEWSLWIPKNLPKSSETYAQYLEQNYPNNSGDLLKTYPIKDPKGITETYADFQSDKTFHLYNRNFAKAMHNIGTNVFMYYFAKQPKGRYPSQYGAFHGAEIAYTLNNLEHDLGPDGSKNIPQSEINYADMVSNYWVNFVKNGNPNQSDYPQWAPWESDNESYLEFGDTIAGKQYLLKTRLDGLEEFLKNQK